MAVRDNIDRTADHDGRASLGTDLPGKIRMPAQIAFRTQGVKVRVHPLGCADPFRQIRDFRNIALNDVKTDFPEQHRCCFIAKTGSPHAHGIEYHGAAQPVGLLPCRQHGLYRPLAERAYVQHQRGAMPDDLLHFTQIIGHDGRTAQSQRHVGTIIDGDIIGNKMHQRPFLPYGAQYIFKWVHPSAFLSPSAGCSSSTRPSHMGPFSPDLGNRLPDTGPYSGNPPTHQSLSSAFLPGGKPCLQTRGIP